MLTELVRVLDEHPDIDVVQPKILRAFSEQGDIDAGTVQSDILDSTGLVLKSAWRMVERGAGEMDTGQFDGSTDIFGASGTIMLVRASAVRAAMIDQEYFDSDFGGGAEAEDIALRLQRGGHGTRYVPTARVHYYQGMFPELPPPWWQRMFQKRSVSRALFSPAIVRNYWWMLVKNLPFGELLRSVFPIFWHRGLRTISAFIFESESRSVLLASLADLPRMLKKRSALQRREHVSMLEVRRYMVKEKQGRGV
jgi:GT2 family glycosyltransferase